MLIEQERIERERSDRLRVYHSRYAEPTDVVPIEICDVVPGSVCRLWFMPNKSSFVVAGEVGDTVKIIDESGSVSGFLSDTLVVVLKYPEQPCSLASTIREFERLMRYAAWGKL